MFQILKIMINLLEISLGLQTLTSIPISNLKFIVSFYIIFKVWIIIKITEFSKFENIIFRCTNILYICPLIKKWFQVPGQKLLNFLWRNGDVQKKASLRDLELFSYLMIDIHITTHHLIYKTFICYYII